MQIYSINFLDFKKNQYVNFNARTKNPLQFKNSDFFVKIRGYGRNTDWAEKIISTADTAVTQICSKAKLQTVLSDIAEGVRIANQYPLDIRKREDTGILRLRLEGWRHRSDWGNGDILTPYGKKTKYKPYEERLDKIYYFPLTNPYNDIELTIPNLEYQGFGIDKCLEHAPAKYIKNALIKIENLYNNLLDNYMGKKISDSNLVNINNTIAEIRWILAHSTPWERGSDAIANVFTRALYKAFDIKTYPLKENLSLDLEAYCTELADYKKNFASYFETAPHIVK